MEIVAFCNPFIKKGSALISLYFNFPTLYFPYTLISLYFNFPTLISLHYDFPIHKRLSYKIRSNQGHTGRWAGWVIVHPCFGRLESALQFNNACANFAMHQGWPCLKVGHAPTPSPWMAMSLRWTPQVVHSAFATQWM